MPIIDHFEFLAPYYDRIFQAGEKDKFLALLSLPADGRVLDVGGGTGRISQLLRNKVEHVFVVDLSVGMLQQASTKNGLLPACSHSEALPFDQDFFDRVIMIDALHHVCDQDKTIQELWRVLKPGGRIVIEEPDVRKFGVKVLAVAEKLLGMRSNFLAPGEIAARFDREASKSITTDGAISWTIVEKINDSSHGG